VLTARALADLVAHQGGEDEDRCEPQAPQAQQQAEYRKADPQPYEQSLDRQHEAYDGAREPHSRNPSDPAWGEGKCQERQVIPRTALTSWRA
jgi:hypothetical protein